MLNWFKDLFSETSDVSMTRFLSFVCVVAAVIIAIIGVSRSQDVTALVATFLGAGLGAKVSQRFIESKELERPVVSSNLQAFKSNVGEATTGSNEVTK